jgi:hypothetical protein
MAYYQNQLFWPPKPRQMVQIILPEVSLQSTPSGAGGMAYPGKYDIELPIILCCPAAASGSAGVSSGIWPTYINRKSKYLKDGSNFVITDIHMEVIDNVDYHPITLWKYKEYWVSGVLQDEPNQKLWQTRMGAPSGSMWTGGSYSAIRDYNSCVGFAVIGDGNYSAGGISGTRVKLSWIAESTSSGVTNYPSVAKTPRFQAILTGYLAS